MSQPISANSVLKIHHFVFNSIHFQRKGFRQNQKDDSERSLQVKVNVNVKKTSTDNYIVTLDLDVEKEDEYIASVSLSGYCEIDDNADKKDVILQVNAPAILFPYARAQLSLLTAQPETEPIVLPVINFQQLYEHSTKGNTGQTKDSP